MENKVMKTNDTLTENIVFISDAHRDFYYDKLKLVRYPDVYHKALCYCLGINNDTRRNIKVVRMAFSLYCNGIPSVDDYTDTEEQIAECRQYTVEDLFCCCYAPYFWQAIQLRYPEYATYNKSLYEILGGLD